MTLNLAHGRGTGQHQALLRADALRANLGRVADMLRAERPDVVAFQEADGPSSWSGRFDHVAEVARRAGYPHRFRGDHVSTDRLRYGTAIISRRPIDGAASHRFSPSFPTPLKGFVVGSVDGIDVVSVHLDFLRAGARRAQMRRMVEVLAGRGRPLVVLGDFNCEWNEALRGLASQLGLHTVRPAAATFPSQGPARRLDWILASRELEFVSYRVVATPLSDHLAVVATLRHRANVE